MAWAMFLSRQNLWVVPEHNNASSHRIPAEALLTSSEGPGKQPVSAPSPKRGGGSSSGSFASSPRGGAGPTSRASRPRASRQWVFSLQGECLPQQALACSPAVAARARNGGNGGHASPNRRPGGSSRANGQVGGEGRGKGFHHGSSFILKLRLQGGPGLDIIGHISCRRSDGARLTTPGSLECFDSLASCVNASIGCACRRRPMSSE